MSIKINGIKKIGEDRTYDIHNLDNELDDGNFCIDGKIVHNSILSDASEGEGINDPHQLTLLNALGHPGPMQSIPTVLENRDDPTQSWKNDLISRSPVMYEILKTTYGVCTYQEQLTALWQRLGGFSATEAQAARKDIAKKRVHKLPAIKEKWLAGASKTLGADFAEEYWNKLETFGRYAFNKCLSHSTKLSCVVTGVEKTVEEWFESDELPKLMAVDEEVFVDSCIDIHYTGEREVFRVKFSDGSFEDVTMGHKFLCEDGEYHEVGEIVSKRLEVTEVEANIPPYC